MLIIGHRGAAGSEPENTLRAVNRAVEVAADWIEIDVRRVEGQLVVFHDAVLDRTTNGHGPLARVSLARLRALDAGHGERVPLLAEVLDLIDARTGLNIEIKEPGLAADIAAVATTYCAARNAWRGRLMLSSFIAAEMAALAALQHECLLGVLFEDAAEAALNRAVALRAYSLNVALRHVDAALIGATHAAGLKVLVYTVNEPADIEICGQLGVDGVFTDYPERAVALRAKLCARDRLTLPAARAGGPAS